MLRVVITVLPLVPAVLPKFLLKLKTVKSNVVILFTNVIIPAFYGGYMLQSGIIDSCVRAAEIKYDLAEDYDEDDDNMVEKEKEALVADDLDESVYSNL